MYTFMYSTDSSKEFLMEKKHLSVLQRHYIIILYIYTYICIYLFVCWEPIKFNVTAISSYRNMLLSMRNKDE